MFMTETATLANAIEALMCQAVAQEKRVTIQLSVTTTEAGQPQGSEQRSWNSIDPIFMKDIANNR